MHKSDSDAESTHINSKKAAQGMATFSLFLFIFPPAGIILALISKFYARKVGSIRAESTATGALIFNIAILVIALFIYLFFKEAPIN